jgi:hypothetical protein
MTSYTNAVNRLRVLRRIVVENPDPLRHPWELICSTTDVDRAEAAAQKERERSKGAYEVQIVGRTLTVTP